MTAADSHKSYRPLTTLMFRAEWVLNGERHDPAVAHGVNVVLHAIVSALVVLLSFYLFPSAVFGSSRASILCAVSAGLVFAVHPVHTESIVGVVSRADLLCTLFFIAGLVSYLTLSGWKPVPAQSPTPAAAPDAAVVAPPTTPVVTATPTAKKGKSTSSLATPKSSTPTQQPRVPTAPAEPFLPVITRSGVVYSAVFVLLFALSTLSKELGVGLVAVCGVWELVRQPFSFRRLVQRGVALAMVFFPYILLRMYLSHEPGTPFLSSFQSSTLEKSGLMRRAENPFAFLTGLPRWLSINFLQVHLAWPQVGLFLASLACVVAVRPYHVYPRHLLAVVVKSFGGPRSGQVRAAAAAAAEPLLRIQLQLHP